MIEFVNVTYTKAPECALHDLNLFIGNDSFQFIFAQNGSERSILLKLLAARAKPQRGDVNLFGYPLSAMKPKQIRAARQNILCLTDHDRLFDHLSLFDNVALPLRLRGIRRSDYLNDVEEMLAWIQLAQQRHKSPDELSPEQKQRALIARSVIAQPRVLIADDPTGFLDSETQNRILRLMIELNRQGTAIVWASADPKLLDLCHARQIILEHGRIRIRDPAPPKATDPRTISPTTPQSLPPTTPLAPIENGPEQTDQMAKTSHAYPTPRLRLRHD